MTGITAGLLFKKPLLFLTALTAFSLSLILPAKHSRAEVLFHDDIALRGRAVMLGAETKGRVFRKGGQVVEFFIDGKSIGSSLSGGDGMAYKEFVPSSYGLLKVKVTSGQDSAAGFILSLRKNAGIVFIDVEGSLLKSPFSLLPMEGSPKAVGKIAKRFPVVYIFAKGSILGMSSLSKWLKENGFPPAPLLEAGTFDRAYELGLRVEAVIGSAVLIESLKDKKFRAFSFEDMEDKEASKDWDEITKSLLR
jgi:hypothetical protein